MEKAPRSRYILPGIPDSHTPTHICDKSEENPSGRKQLTSFLFLSLFDSSQCLQASSLVQIYPCSQKGSQDHKSRSRQVSPFLDSSVAATWKGKAIYFLCYKVYFFHHYAIKDIIKENLEIMKKRRKYLQFQKSPLTLWYISLQSFPIYIRVLLIVSK